MEGLGWEAGGAEVVNSPSLWSNIYQPYMNYCAEINNMDPIQPFSDKYSTFVTNNDVSQTSIIAPTTTIWQQNNTVVQPVNNDTALHQQGGLHGVLSMKSSLDSLDCLLSTTNSNTDTSIDDEAGAISSPMVLPEHSRSFWNFGSDEFGCTNNNNASNDKGKEKEGGSKKRGRSGCDNVVRPDPVPPKPKRFRPGKNNYNLTNSSTISFQLNPLSPTSSIDQAEPDQEAIAQMKEMIYRAAAFRPVNLGPEVVEKPKRKNVRTSSDPQTMAARQRRERISDRIRVLQRIVPGGTKMDTASMLDEAANYLKFLQTQIKALENLGPKFLDSSSALATNCNIATSGNLSFSSIPFTHSLLGPMHGHIPLLYP